MEKEKRFNIWAALEERYAGEAWAYFREVRNGTGFTSRKPRTADGLAMSLWPSRGLEIHGIEVKESRFDWLRELEDPAKVEEGLYPYCDRWWVAVSSKEQIVLAGELPPTWGLLAPRGGKLAMAVEAPKLQPKPFDRLILASILKKAKGYMVLDEEVQRKIQDARRAGEELGKHHAETDGRLAIARLKIMERNVMEFEQTAGISIISWGPKEQGEKFRKFLEVIGREDVVAEAEWILERLRGMICKLEEQIKALKG